MKNFKNFALTKPQNDSKAAIPHNDSLERRGMALFGATMLLALALPVAIAAQTVINSLDPGVLNTALQGGGTVTFSIDGTIVLTNVITLSNSVILDGTNHSITISGGGAVQIFNILPAGQTTLRNLTLANGEEIGSYIDYGQTYPANAYGGAIFTQGTLDVENCTLTNNLAIGGSGILEEGGCSGYGGAIYNAGLLSISNTLFVYNGADGGSGSGDYYGSGGSGAGGAICNAGGTVNLGNVSFSNNSTSGALGSGAAFGNTCGTGAGGAFYSSGGSLQADNLQVFNNSANGGVGSGEIYFSSGINGGAALGGAFYFNGGAVAVSNGIFSNNRASGGSGDYGAGGISQGGGIYNSGVAFFWNCNLVGSQAQGAFGGVYGISYAANGMGGAIYNTGTMQVVSSTVSNSSATGGPEYSHLGAGADALGGAVYNTGTLEIESTILAGNSAAGGFGGNVYSPLSGNGWGGAIANTGFIQLSNTILSNNVATGATDFGDAIYSTGAIQSDANSTLTSYVSGTPPLVYQWQINGSNIAGATNSTFNLGNIQFANSGTYDLVSSNGIGLVANFVEIVNQPPPLAISSVVPNYGLPGGGTKVTISGVGFTSGATVCFGNAAATAVSVASATNITATTGPATTFGAVNVVVTNGDFQPVVLTNGFTYVAPPQNLTACLSPGQGMQCQYTGTPGFKYVLLATTNLAPPIHWQPVMTNLADTNGNCTYTGAIGQDCPMLFYSAMLPSQ